MNEEIDPLDPTGLTFGGDGSRYEQRSRTFTVTGFRDGNHAQSWADAYYKRAMGYGPIIRVNQTANTFTVHVNEMTSCD